MQALTSARQLAGLKPQMPQTPRDLLQVFTRFPDPGKVKTRLIPALGPENAARLQFQMTRHLLDQARELPSGTRVEVHLHGGSARLMSALFGEDLDVLPQSGHGLGDRMARALKHGLDRGAGRVVLVGSDCPAVDVRVLSRAFETLSSRDVVFGPAEDGGFYLLGLSSSVSRDRVAPLLSTIEWGTSRVLSQTTDKAAELGLSSALVDTLPDIDRPEDLGRIPGQVLSPMAPCLSVVIPVLNEAANLSQTLASLSSGFEVEILVVDGGSSDASVEVAERSGASVLRSEPGRGRQMNLGAGAAQGDLLFFLHGDSQAPFLFDWYIRQGMRRSGTVGGSFSFGLDKRFPGAGLITTVTNVRSRMLRLPYGDQGLFLSASLFRELGGFPETQLLEDVHMVQALKRKGGLVIVPVPVVTSGRRWTRLGPLRTTLINQLIMAGYLLRVPETQLARLYGRLRALAGQRGRRPR